MDKEVSVLDVFFFGKKISCEPRIIMLDGKLHVRDQAGSPLSARVHTCSIATDVGTRASCPSHLRSQC